MIVEKSVKTMDLFFFLVVFVVVRRHVPFGGNAASQVPSFLEQRRVVCLLVRALDRLRFPFALRPVEGQRPSEEVAYRDTPTR